MSDEYKEMRIDGIDDSMNGRDIENDRLRQQLAALKSELKTIGNAIDDPRTDLTMTMSEVIIEQKKQLAAALAAIKVKDAALQSAISAHKYESGDLHDALAIHPDDMKEVKMECFLAGGELRWRDESLSVLREWIRQPQHDLIAKVPK